MKATVGSEEGPAGARLERGLDCKLGDSRGPWWLNSESRRKERGGGGGFEGRGEMGVVTAGKEGRYSSCRGGSEALPV